MHKTLVDTHCHYYPCYPIAEFWDHAWENFSVSASEPAPIVCLTDLEGTHWFQDIREQTDKQLVCDWQVDAGDDLASFSVRSHDKHIRVVSSRQVNSLEGLEVLVIGSTEDIPARKPIDYYIEQFSADYTVILPWGFGKWLGRRGKIIEGLIQQLNDRQVMLGDNGGRPLVWSRIAAFEQAKNEGVPILPGSDPLPLANQLSRVAALGIELNSHLPVDMPLSKALTQALKTQGKNVQAFGSHRSLTGIILDQIALRMR